MHERYTCAWTVSFLTACVRWMIAMTIYPNTAEHPGSPSPIPTCYWTPSPLSLCQNHSTNHSTSHARRMNKPHRWIPLYCHLLGFRSLLIRVTRLQIQWEKMLLKYYFIYYRWCWGFDSLLRPVCLDFAVQIPQSKDMFCMLIGISKCL